MDSKGSMEIQKRVTKLLNSTIAPYRPTSGLIIEEIDDD